MLKKFRRGKKFQNAYFDIGKTNQMINGLKIEAETFSRVGNNEEAKNRLESADKLRAELISTYNSETYDLDYILPQVSGLYVKQSKKDILK